MAESRISLKRSGGGSTPIEVANYSALPTVGTAPGTTYIVLASQGTYWLPGSLGGTYYPKGYYYDATTEYIYTETPYQATQATVDAGINDDQFVTAKTFNDSLQLTKTSLLTKLEWFNIINITPSIAITNTGETIIDNIELPTLSDGILRIYNGKYIKNGISASRVRWYISDVPNNIGGSAILIATSASWSLASQFLQMDRTFSIVAGNIKGVNANAALSSDQGSTNNATPLDVVLPTGTLYLIPAVTNSTIGDSTIQQSICIKNF